MKFLTSAPVTEIDDLKYLRLSSNSPITRENSRLELSRIDYVHSMQLQEQNMSTPMSMHDIKKESRGMINIRTDDAQRGVKR